MQKKLIFILCLVSLNSFGQEYFWSEAQLAGTNNPYLTKGGMAISSEGDKIVVNSFLDDLHIGDMVLHTDSLIGVYMAKYDSADSLLWCEVILECSFQYGISTPYVYLDNDNKIYLLLHLPSPIVVNSTTIVSNSLNSSLPYFALIKFDPHGEFEQSFVLDTDCRNSLSSVEFDQNNDLILMAVLGDSNNDGCYCVVNNDTLSIQNKSTIIFKLNELQNIQYINGFNAAGLELKLNNDMLYVCGTSMYALNINMGNYEIDFPTTYDKGGFCAKMDTTGDIKWAKYFGVRGWDSHITISNIDMLSPNDIIVLGYSFSQSEPNKIYFENASTLNGNSWDSNDYFIVNYDSLGQVKWHTKSSSSGDEYIKAMTYREDLEEIYIAGSFNNYISFNGSTYSSASDDAMVLCYDIEGNEKWIKFAGGAGMDKAWAIALDSQNNIYVNGSTSSNPSQFGAHSYTTENGANVFLAKMEYSAIGIEEIQDEDLKIKISPNPNAGTFTIRSDKYDIKGLVIYDLLGKELYKNKLDKPIQELFIQLQNYTQGTYIALIETEEGVLSPKKIIFNSTNEPESIRIIKM